MIYVEIDEIVPCLIDAATGKEVQTVVSKMTSSELRGFTSRNNWYVNWQKTAKEDDVYALHVKGSSIIEGLVALRTDNDAGVVLIDWAVANPLNNSFLLKGKPKRYIGVGGHLFAIAVDYSIKHGFDGIVIGHPSGRKLMKYYIEKLGAEEFFFPDGHAYTIVIWEKAAENIRRTYSYEYSDQQGSF